MRIRILTSMAGGYTFDAGDEADIEPRIATAWIAAGIAEPVGRDDMVETAVASAPETAARRRSRRV